MADQKSAAEMAAEVVQATVKDKIVTLGSGAVVRAKPIPDSLIVLMRKQNPPPVPPTVTVESGGKVWDEGNPSDPIYKSKLAQYRIEIGDAFTELILLAGMEILEHPPGVKSFEEEDVGESPVWSMELSSIGLKIPDDKFRRKLIWIRYKIAPSTSDMELISGAYGEAAEVDEEDIKAIEETF